MLICAGWLPQDNQIDRELPVVYLRGSRAEARATIAGVEGSPFVGLCRPTTRFTSLQLVQLGPRSSGKLRDCPQKACQLTSDGHGCHCGSLVPVDHLCELSMQSSVGFLGDAHHLGRKVLPSLAERLAHLGLTPGMPGRFHQDSSRMGVASFGDGPSSLSRAAAVFARHQPYRTHEAWSTSETS